MFLNTLYIYLHISRTAYINKGKTEFYIYIYTYTLRFFQSSVSYDVLLCIITYRALHFGERKSSSVPSMQGLKSYCYKNAGWMDK